MKIGCQAPDGRENLFAVLGPSDMFGELAAIDPGPRTCTATAVTDVRAAVVHRDTLMPWMAEHPGLGQRLLQLLARRLSRTDHDLSDLVFNDVAGRVAKQLLRLAQQFGVQDKKVTRVSHGLTQEEFAQLVGAARETVNKVLADFSTRGWITWQGKSVLITDSARLFSRGRETVLHSALTNAEAIGTAKSIMMRRFGIDDRQAFTVLTKLSQDFNTTVSDIATDIIRGGFTASIVDRPLQHQTAMSDFDDCS